MKEKNPSRVSARQQAFIDCYYADNAELQSEVDFDFIYKNIDAIQRCFRRLIKCGLDEWIAAEEAYHQIKQDEI